jgi:hypothetical protein
VNRRHDGRKARCFNAFGESTEAREKVNGGQVVVRESPPAGSGTMFGGRGHRATTANKSKMNFIRRVCPDFG